MRKYIYNHTPINFSFQQSKEDFFVEELPIINATKKGEYFLLKIKKRDMSTWKLISVLKSAIGASDRDIGYAGLKDKNATTIQYITIPKKFEKGLKNLKTDRIEILEKSLTNSALKPGKLKGNRFVINLRKTNTKDAKRLIETAKIMSNRGIPNFFGYQRFGEDGKSYLQGKEISRSGKRLKGAKERLLVASWQSYLFNSWLQKRIEISKIVTNNPASKAAKILDFPLPLIKELQKQKQFFKLFLGEALLNKRGKIVWANSLQKASSLFMQKELTPTGLLPGFKAQRAKIDAAFLEAEFDDEELTSLKGDRRAAWIWPQKINGNYKERKRILEFGFELPAGSFATNFLEELAKQPIRV